MLAPAARLACECRTEAALAASKHFACLPRGHKRAPLHALCWCPARRLRWIECCQRRVSAARQGGSGARQRRRRAHGAHGRRRGGRPGVAAGTPPAAAADGGRHRPDRSHAGRDGRTGARARGDGGGERRRRRRAARCAAGRAPWAARRRRTGRSISAAQIAFPVADAAGRRRCCCCGGVTSRSAASPPPGAGGLHQRPAQARPAAGGALGSAALPLVPARGAAAEGATRMAALLSQLCLTPERPAQISFCSAACLHEHQLRSDPGYARKARRRRCGDAAANPRPRSASSCAARSRGVAARR